MEPVFSSGSEHCSSGLLCHDKHILYIYFTLHEHKFSQGRPTDVLPAALNNFSTNWYLALNFASSQAALIIPSLITLVDPDKTSSFVLGDVLTAFTAGFAFLSVPEISAVAFGIEEATVTAAKALIAGLQQAPGVGKAIWPTGTLSSQLVQMGDLAGTLGKLDSEVGDMINNGLQLLMSDVPSFVNFASTGSWSGGSPYSLPNTAKGLELGLKTFLVSTAMAKNLKPNTLVGMSFLLLIYFPGYTRLPQQRLQTNTTTAKMQRHVLRLRLLGPHHLRNTRRLHPRNIHHATRQPLLRLCPQLRH